MEVNETLATELIHEIKVVSRRWFIAFCVMVGLELATIGGFMWYITLPTEDIVSVENDDGNANYIGNDLNGDVINGEDNKDD